MDDGPGGSTRPATNPRMIISLRGDVTSARRSRGDFVQADIDQEAYELTVLDSLGRIPFEASAAHSGVLDAAPPPRYSTAMDDARRLATARMEMPCTDREVARVDIR